MNRKRCWIVALGVGCLGATSVSADPVEWQLPAVHMGPGKRDFAPMASPAWDDARGATMRATPMLDQLVGDQNSAGAVQRRRASEVDLGALSLGLEALRSKATRDAPNAYGSRTESKSWSAGLRAGWARAAERFWLGLATVRQASREPDVLAARGRLKTNETMLGGGWQHGDHLRLNLEWRHVAGGAANSGVERIVQIANGAGVHESGYRLAAEWAPGGYAGSAGTSFGLEARSAQIARADAAMLGVGRADTRLGLFMRARF